MINVLTYNKYNDSFNKKLVFHLGVDAGFFSEYNNMLLAILYCLKNQIKFQFYSLDANFGHNLGWRDYFENFTTESKWNYHKKYNYRTKAVFDHYYTKKLSRKINLYKKLSSTDYLTYELFDKIRDQALTTSTYNIPALNINGDIKHACKQIFDITWKYNSLTHTIIRKKILDLNLPKTYIGIHIRSGDKFKEVELKDVDAYIKKAESVSSLKDVFISTDDFSNIITLKTNYPNWTFYHLCDESSRGYYQDKFQNFSKDLKKKEIIDLLTSIEILNESEVFIGTYTSNIGMFLGIRKESSQCFDVESRDWSVW